MNHYNLHKVKTIRDMKEVEFSDIVLNEHYYIENTPGVIESICTYQDGKKAILKSVNKNWPRELTVTNDVEGLTLSELSEVLTCASKGERHPLIIEASKLGFVNFMSYTQFGPTSKGIAEEKRLRETAIKNGKEITISHNGKNLRATLYSEDNIVTNGLGTPSSGLVILDSEKVHKALMSTLGCADLDASIIIECIGLQINEGGETSGTISNDSYPVKWSF